MHVRDLQAHAVETGTQVWGVEIATNPDERLLRMGEEFLELLRSGGLKFSTLQAMAYHEYFERHKGEVPQEVAGALNTLLSYANSRGICAESEAVLDLARLLENKEKARAKHATKQFTMRAA